MPTANATAVLAKVAAEQSWAEGWNLPIATYFSLPQGTIGGQRQLQLGLVLFPPMQ
jgi:hypothetical protein